MKKKEFLLPVHPVQWRFHKESVFQIKAKGKIFQANALVHEQVDFIIKIERWVSRLTP